MKTVLTGGIGSGKSYVARLLSERGLRVYDCDSAAKRLMRTSEELRSQLIELIGTDAYIYNKVSDEWQLQKPVVTRFLMADSANQAALNALVHPTVIADFLASGSEWIESAIAFEAGIDHIVDRIVVVTAPIEVRISRIMARDGISRSKALDWIERQLPQEELERRADILIVNDGTTPLQPQIDRLLPDVPADISNSSI